ncbi:MAG: hypothetical protein L0K12_06940 [Brevibacterium aurantiacum]|nr:hypothetical protein [Brevibacterium aurantiacum]
MANEAMMADWNRSQNVYQQTRRFTPGEQSTDVRVTDRGQAKMMELLVIEHNDVDRVPPGYVALDIMVHQEEGSHSDAGEHANAHLTNRYDPVTGVTTHTELYPKEVLYQLSATNGMNGFSLPDRLGGVPGAMIYNAQATVMPDPDGHEGSFVFDADGPMQASERSVSRYTLHDQQLLMENAAQRQLSGQYASPGTSVPAPDAYPIPDGTPGGAAGSVQRPEAAVSAQNAAPKQMPPRAQPSGPVAPKPVSARPSGPVSAKPVSPKAVTPSNARMTPGKSSSQAGLAGVRIGSSMSGMRPDVKPKGASPPRSVRIPPRPTHDPIVSRPINKGPQPDPDIIDRVPTQEELVARKQAGEEAGRGGFEAHEGEGTAGATARGFTEGLSGTISGGQSLANMGKPAEKVDGPSAVEDRLEKRPWLKEIVDQADQADVAPPEQSGELER